jgi:cell division protein FtsB
MGNALLGANGPRDLLLLRQRRAQLEVARTKLMARQAELETSVQNLRSNDRYIEHLIRRELGYARPDELVYKFTGEPPAPAAPYNSARARSPYSRALRSSSSRKSG